LTDALVAAAARGDQAACGLIYTALAPAVLGYARTCGVDDPESLTQEAFLKLLPQLPKVTGGAEGVRRLAFTIARARVIDAVRARSRAVRLVPYDAETDQRAVRSAEEDAHSLLSLERVRAVLDVLPDDQRDVLILRVVADLSIDQIAEVMGRSSGAVKQLQRRGLIAVRQALAERRVSL
jgi:RNA polymerase sigma-70 factor (ECF subfamily)